MLEKSFGLLFFLKTAKNLTQDERYVFMRITIEGKSKEISTRQLWSRVRWNPKTGRAGGTKEDARKLNAYLDSLSMKVLQAKQVLLDSNKEINAENVKNLLLGQGDDSKMILQVFKVHNQKMESLVGQEYAPGTLERFKTAYDHTQSFIKWKFGKEDLEIKKLDYEFISDFEYWFKSVRKCSHNTSMKYLTNLKKIVLSCVKRGWLVRDPFMDYKMVKKEVIRVALTEDELMRISKRTFPAERLNQIRDIFIFSVYTGLAYVDVKNLRRDQIIIGMDGEKWLVTHRQKTDTPTRLPLLPKAMAIIKKYENHPYCENKGVVLPVLSNQKTNAYLKEISDLCEIQKELTFHIARHTFATTITLSNGVPIETVSKMLGHKSLQQTQHYAKILDNKISLEMKSLRGILEKKEKPKKPKP